MSRSAVPNFTQIGHETHKIGVKIHLRNQVWLSQSQLSDRLTHACPITSVKNSQTEFHEYTTKGLVAEIKLQTDGQKGSL